MRRDKTLLSTTGKRAPNMWRSISWWRHKVFGLIFLWSSHELLHFTKKIKWLSDCLLSCKQKVKTPLSLELQTKSQNSMRIVHVYIYYSVYYGSHNFELKSYASYCRLAQAASSMWNFHKSSFIWLIYWIESLVYIKIRTYRNAYLANKLRNSVYLHIQHWHHEGVMLYKRSWVQLGLVNHPALIPSNDKDGLITHYYQYR